MHVPIAFGFLEVMSTTQLYSLKKTQLWVVDQYGACHKICYFLMTRFLDLKTNLLTTNNDN